MTTLTKTTTTTTFNPQDLDNFYLHTQQHSNFLQEVIEGLLDGILIVCESGELLHANTHASRICSRLNQGRSDPNVIPVEIWQICEYLIESRDLFPEQHITLFDELVLDKSTTFRIRVRWLNLEQFARPCLLVTIEDRYESLKNKAFAEAQKYNMTPREAEIWSLYRAHYSYKEIAAELYITLNTVKKHMKNIHAKRQVALSEEE